MPSIASRCMDATTIKLLSDVLHGGKRASLEPGTMQAVIGVPHQVPHGAGGRAYNADAAGGVELVITDCRGNCFIEWRQPHG